ncbi:MAG: 5'-methylthioadenosine/S-adenosylhomocysteine nucleosidase [Pseudomonadota bacterium]
MPYALKTVGAKTLLYVMAAEPEYGPALRARFSPLFTGIGPVEAALALGAALARLDAAGRTPDLVVSLGSAGSRSLPMASVHQARAVSYRDMDASALGFPVGCTPLLDEPAVATLHTWVPGLSAVHLGTGASVVSGDGYDRVEADMVDMETYAIYRACRVFGCELAALRGVSDGAEPLAELADWTRYLAVIDARLAEVVDRLEAALAGPGSAA